MLDPELKQELDTLSVKIDAAFQSAEKTRRYILWTIIGSVLIVLLPLLILPFFAGSLLSSYSSALSF